MAKIQIKSEKLTPFGEIFFPVCPALIGRVVHYTPSSEPNIQTKIELRFI